MVTHGNTTPQLWNPITQTPQETRGLYVFGALRDKSQVQMTVSHCHSLWHILRNTMQYIHCCISELSVRKEFRSTPKLRSELTSYGCVSSANGYCTLIARSSKCFSLPVSIISVLPGFSFFQLLLSKQWASLVPVILLYVVKLGRRVCYLHIVGT